MKVTVREYTAHDLAAMTGIWNEVVAAGNAFPQEEPLTPSAAADFLHSKAIAALPNAPQNPRSPMIKKFSAYTFCTPTTSVAADTLPTPATPSRPKAAACISVKSWCLTVWNRQGVSDLKFCSLMPL